MSFLLPQDRDGDVLNIRQLDLHGDRYVDVSLALDGSSAPLTARLGVREVPEGLAAGDRVRAHVVMGVVTKLERV